jgi:polysaccharide pyruvyl transferase WcaK-like protein
LKILHIASFIGNIGDNASHQGFHHILNHFFPKYSVTNIEIRKFYKNYQHLDKQSFDEGFIQYANQFDLLVIGGGGFLDYWVEESATGTTIDIEPGLLGSLDVPTLITSVGCMPHKPVPPGNIEKFRTFLDCALANPKIRIAVRNDGSVNSLHNVIGAHYGRRIPEVLDSGFFYQASSGPSLPVPRKYAAINITHDQINMHGAATASTHRPRYYEQLAEVVEHIIVDHDLDIVLVPHIYSDLIAISHLLEKMDDFLIREHVGVAPCIQGAQGADYLFSIYKNSALVLGTRLHANICSLAMAKAAIGLVALSRVQYVYDFLGLGEQCVLLDGNFSAKLQEKIAETLRNKIAMERALSQRCHQEKKKTLQIYQTFFTDLMPSLTGIQQEPPPATG